MSMTVMEVIFIMPEILPYGWCLEFEESCCENNGSIINSTVKSFSVMNSFSGELRGINIKMKQKQLLQKSEKRNKRKEFCDRSKWRWREAAFALREIVSGGRQTSAHGLLPRDSWPKCNWGGGLLLLGHYNYKWNHPNLKSNLSFSPCSFFWPT